MSNFKNFLATTFLGGLVVILPLAIFAILAKWVIGFFDGIIDPIASLFPERWNEVLIKILAFAIITALCFIIGLIVRTQFGTSLFNWFEEQLFSRLPLYSTIKDTVQQFFGKEKSAFSQVVLIEPFGKGAKMVGFITDETDDGVLTVFTPTAPNPTNGYVFVVNKADAEYIEAKSELAMRNIISLGAGTGKMLQKARAKNKESQN
ncbi:MAG: DUF502 domain-containing protein [Chitinophagales bacterium]|nr:DUF502 domain-containing protein [Bacteroidota bacterium]MCB9256513.1 DUF502 domain-containing protein [Chitinophagales bacterium]